MAESNVEVINIRRNNLANLKKLIKDRGLDKKKLADAVGLSLTSLYGKFSGYAGFYHNEIVQIVKSMDLTPQEVYDLLYKDWDNDVI